MMREPWVSSLGRGGQAEQDGVPFLQEPGESLRPLRFLTLLCD